MNALSLPTQTEIRATAERLTPYLTPTPLLAVQQSAAGGRVLVKAEMLQPAGSFKARGAMNFLLHESDPSRVIYTASAGNMAQALSWAAGVLGRPAAIVVPDSAPRAKTDRILERGVQVRRVPFDEWWTAMIEGEHDSCPGGLFLHPFSDPRVIAGNATIGLEIARQAPDVDAVVVPFGGGGLALGIACGLRAAGLAVPVYPAEVETAAPLRVAWDAGHPVEPQRQPSFIDGIGGRAVFPEIWQHARTLLAEPLVCSVAQAAGAIRLLADRTKVVGEGAAGAALAAATALGDRHQTVVAVGSGGNIDLDVAGRIIAGANR